MTRQEACGVSGEESQGERIEANAEGNSNGNDDIVALMAVCADHSLEHRECAEEDGGGTDTPMPIDTATLAEQCHADRIMAEPQLCRGWEESSVEASPGVGVAKCAGLGVRGDSISDVAVEKAVEPVARSTRQLSSQSKSKSNKVQRTEAHKRSKRAAKRRQAQEAAGTSLKAVALRRAAMSVARQANGYGIESAPHASTGYIGKWGGTKPMSPTGGRVSNQSETMLRSLRDQGFQLVPWDG